MYVTGTKIKGMFIFVYMFYLSNNSYVDSVKCDKQTHVKLFNANLLYEKFIKKTNLN